MENSYKWSYQTRIVGYYLTVVHPQTISSYLANSLDIMDNANIIAMISPFTVLLERKLVLSMNSLMGIRKWVFRADSKDEPIPVTLFLFYRSVRMDGLNNFPLSLLQG